MLLVNSKQMHSSLNSYRYFGASLYVHIENIVLFYTLNSIFIILQDCEDPASPVSFFTVFGVLFAGTTGRLSSGMPFVSCLSSSLPNFFAHIRVYRYRYIPSLPSWLVQLVPIYLENCVFPPKLSHVVLLSASCVSCA
jgi:hypothetical protein